MIQGGTEGQKLDLVRMEMSERERVREMRRREDVGQGILERELLGKTNAEPGGRGWLTRIWWTR